MSERENFFDGGDDFYQSVQKYEEQLKKNKPLFFDTHTFEDLISYYEMRGALNKALGATDYAISIYPFSASFLVKKASLLMQQKKLSKAMTLLNAAEAIEPGEIGVYLLRSDIYLIRENHEEALKEIRKAMDITEEEQMPDLWLELADVYEDWGKTDEVFDCIKTSILLDPENEEALNRMWYAVEISRRYEDSVEFHKNLLEEFPYSYLAWQNLGQAYYFLNLFEKAVESYEFVMAINETYDLAYRDCAEAHFKLKNFHQSIECYQKAIHYSRPSEELYFCIGECYERMKDFGKARLHYRKVLNLSPQFAYAHYRIGLTYRAEKQFHSSLIYLSKAIRFDDTKVTFLLSAARVATLLDDEGELIFINQKLLSIISKVKGLKAYEQIIQLLLELNLNDVALETISKVEQSKSHSVNLTLLKSVAAFKEGWTNYGLELFSQVLFEDATKAKMFFRMLPELRSDEEVLRIIDIYR